jgi:hypothetical protein
VTLEASVHGHVLLSGGFRRRDRLIQCMHASDCANCTVTCISWKTLSRSQGFMAASEPLFKRLTSVSDGSFSRRRLSRPVQLTSCRDHQAPLQYIEIGLCSAPSGRCSGWPQAQCRAWGRQAECVGAYRKYYGKEVRVAWQGSCAHQNGKIRYLLSTSAAGLIKSGIIPAAAALNFACTRRL